MPPSSNAEENARFCPACAAPLEARQRFDQLRKCCTACDYVQYLSPACAAAVVVARGRELVLVRRGIEPFRGDWGLPAGFQDYWETPQETAIREVREETGLEIDLVRLLDVLYTRDDPRKRVNVAVFLGRPVAGVLRAGDDAEDARFFGLDALPEPVAFANNRAILQRLRREFPTGDLH